MGKQELGKTDILISDLEDITEILDNNGYGMWGRRLEDAMELLKKQKAVEPEYFMDGLVKRCRCKNCGKHIVSVGRYRDNYCAKCGQAVKWE